MEIYTLFGIIFLSSILLGNAMYSDNTSIYAQKIQTGTENEAEVNTDIEQENKCKKDTECENENEINNVLDIKNITNIVTVQQETDTTATLNVIKNVICQVDDGLDANLCDGIGPDDFDITVTGNNPSPSNFPGSDSGTSVTLEAGQYTVSETNNIPSGNNPITVVASFGDDCTKDGDFDADGTISAGQEQTCTITNNVTIEVEETTATLNVIKNVNCRVEEDALGALNGECDSIGPDDFDITVTGNNPSPSNFPGSSSGTSVTLDAGPYTVSETNNIVGDIEINAQFSGDCTQDEEDFEADGTISAGQEQTCTITNTVIIED